MPVPLHTGRSVAVLAAVFAAPASLTLAAPMQGGQMMQEPATMSIKHLASFSFGAPGKAAAVGRALRIKAHDVGLDVPAVKVKAGETARFVVSNASATDQEPTLGDVETQGGIRE